MSPRGGAMRAISIIGYKKSGKTKLSELILAEWEKASIHSDYLKFSHHSFDQEGTDTARMVNENRTVFGISSSESITIYGEERTLLNTLPQCKNKLLLIEGGKKETILPRVVCLRSKDEFRELSAGLAVATYGFDESTATNIVPHFTIDRLDELAKFMHEKAFILAGLNCKACGKKSCHELAQDIILGKCTVESCTPKNTKNIDISINNMPLNVNPFVEEIIAGAVKGMLEKLKGHSEGDITIRIKG